MKKILAFLMFLLLMTATSASAFSFGFDPTATDGDTGVTIDRFDGQILGPYHTIQNLGDNGQIDNGETFYHAYVTTSDGDSDGLVKIDTVDTDLLFEITHGINAANGSVAGSFWMANGDYFSVTASDLGGYVGGVDPNTGNYMSFYTAGTFDFYFNSNLIGTFDVVGGDAGPVNPIGVLQMPFEFNLQASWVAENVWYDDQGNDFFDMINEVQQTITHWGLQL